MYKVLYSWQSPLYIPYCMWPSEPPVEGWKMAHSSKPSSKDRLHGCPQDSQGGIYLGQIIWKLMFDPKTLSWNTACLSQKWIGLGILTPKHKPYRRLLKTCEFQLKVLGWDIELPMGDVKSPWPGCFVPGQLSYQEMVWFKMKWNNLP